MNKTQNNKVPCLELASGLSISRILTGLWQITDFEKSGAKLDLDLCAQAMAPYVKAGLTTFDMADHYGPSERIAGRFREMTKESQSLQYLTKWVPMPGPVTQATVASAMQRALDNLKTDSIDLMQFHAWNYADPAWLDCLYYLQEQKYLGRIKHLGLTNFDTAHLRIVVQSGIKIVSNQVCFSLLDLRPQRGMIDLCEKFGIKLLAYGTLAGGFLSEFWLDRAEPQLDSLDSRSKMKYKRFIDAAGGWQSFQQVLQVVHQIAQQHEVSIPNIACRYILEQASVAGIIIGAHLGQSEHIEKNLRLFQFSLDSSSIARLDQALATLKPVHRDCGDEYRTPPYLTASGDLGDDSDRIPAPCPVVTDAQDRQRVVDKELQKLTGSSRAIRIGHS